MPDRIIAATALDLGIPLVTRDRSHQTVGIGTIWQARRNRLELWIWPLAFSVDSAAGFVP